MVALIRSSLREPGRLRRFGLDGLETDSRASLFRNFATGYLQGGVSVFPLDPDRQ
jgi:hypothetical protein